MRAAHEVPSQSQAPGLGEPGANPLFFGVLIALTLGLVAGLTSSGTTTLLRSNLVFRVAVGGIVAGVAYVAVAAVRFAWHRRTFKGFRGPGFGADAPEQIARARQPHGPTKSRSSWTTRSSRSTILMHG